METVSRQNVRVAKFAMHGYAGATITVVAEVLLFGGNQFVGHWFTPIVWTGYILFVDTLLFKIKGRSPLVSDRLEFLVLAVISVGGWWLCEFYNAPRFWNSNLELWWHYHNLEPNPYLRRVGYDWAFATIFPLQFLTAELLRITVFKRFSNRRPVAVNRRPLLIFLAAVGAAAVIWPLIVPSVWLAPVIWLSFILLLDPVNALRGWPSITADLARGDWRRLLSLLAAGFVCGFLWEFFNYWALSKWTYTVPYFGNIKIFEMPILGFLGFPPFAIECWAMYIFVRSLLRRRPPQTANAEIFLDSKE
jgi:hypothetical protein